LDVSGNVDSSVVRMVIGIGDSVVGRMIGSEWSRGWVRGGEGGWRGGYCVVGGGGVRWGLNLEIYNELFFT
jgi:hypothetical protein